MSSRTSVKASPVQLTEQRPHRETISLNEVVRQVLQKQKEVSSRRMVMRCQELPVVEGFRDEVYDVFSRLLNTILPQKWRVGKLFLHINCEELVKDVDAELTQGRKRYLVHVHTNLSTSPEWKAANADTLQYCSAVLQKMDADFTVNEVLNTGCIFSISLLGKL